MPGDLSGNVQRRIESRTRRPTIAELERIAALSTEADQVALVETLWPSSAGSALQDPASPDPNVRGAESEDSAVVLEVRADATFDQASEASSLALMEALRQAFRAELASFAEQLKAGIVEELSSLIPTIQGAASDHSRSALEAKVDRLAAQINEMTRVFLEAAALQDQLLPPVTGQCRFPVNDERAGEPYEECGNAVYEPRKSYCRIHDRRAHVKPGSITLPR